MGILDELEAQNMKEKISEFHVGDTIDVHVRIQEGEKERVQIFNGTVIKRQGAGVRETFTVRRIVQGEGVERTFPLHSPSVLDIAVKRRGDVRRARLYYLRDRVGKGVRVKEKIWRKEDTKAGSKSKAQAPTSSGAAEDGATEGSQA
jgi:large subunit ribosomal protein L19